ncbi:flagellar biosynthetic protein FliR [Cobetia marina]|uniref:flagellar biosynthetic protein FliR n=1 Tax=Cobetia marina TaxID=28258 RepID=UPI00114212BF|nr:flagellar biosynthetic protein FliR [Cobetia marina]GED40855.1 flagellar biosynthetic protein FliR [Cobetia marina]
MDGLAPNQLQAMIVSVMWPFARLSGFMLIAPIFGHRSLPTPVRLLMAFGLAVIIAPLIDSPPAPDMLGLVAVWQLALQMAVGMALGLVMRITFAIVEAAGEFIGLQMGLAFASFFSEDTGTNTQVLSRLLGMLAMLLFLAFNGHLLVLEILVGHFHDIPLDLARLGPPGLENLLLWSASLFSAGLLLALPLVASLLAINLAMGVLNRSAPQLSVFSIGFPLTLLLGIAMLWLMMPGMTDWLSLLFRQALSALQAVHAGLGSGL